MKKVLIVGLMAMMFATGIGCTNMSRTQQGVASGAALGALGLYGPFAEWAGAGATVPLTGFGWLLAKGTAKAVSEQGVLGALTGGVTAAAGGIAAAVFFGLLAALIFKPKSKS